MKQPILAYCDYIAFLIRENLMDLDKNHLLDEISRVQFDIGMNDEFCSTTKTIDVLDMQGKQYRITIQEL
jgi:hypothetical protein